MVERVVYIALHLSANMFEYLMHIHVATVVVNGFTWVDYATLEKFQFEGKIISCLITS